MRTQCLFEDSEEECGIRRPSYIYIYILLYLSFTIHFQESSDH